MAISKLKLCDLLREVQVGDHVMSTVFADSSVAHVLGLRGAVKERIQRKCADGFHASSGG
jgi:hypothetical protein